MLLRSSKRKREAPTQGSFDDSENTKSRRTALGAKKRRLLPSPSTSYSKDDQVELFADQHRFVPACNRPAPRSRSSSLFRSSEQHPSDGQSNQPEHQPPHESPRSVHITPSNGANENPVTEPNSGCSAPQDIDDNHPESHCVANDITSNQFDPIGHWAETKRWPEIFATMSQGQSESSQKRPRSVSYSQSVRDGDAPKAYSPAFEDILTDNGVFMEEVKGRSLVAPESKTLYAKLLQGRYPDPKHTAFALSDFMSVWQRAQPRNEGRVYRDLTALLVPSPELLHIGGQAGLEHVAEEISAEWSKGQTLGGPKPKPDFAAGISARAFDDKQIAKLRNYTSYERPTKFTDNIYFPFLLCEVKCGNEGINRADRQNMHSSSMAVKAIVELVRGLGDDNKVTGLNGQTLVFSISHDNERVKIYGHFPVTASDKTTFYRYPVASSMLNFDEDRGWKKTHDFVMGIYKTFYPKHLKRICDALALMDDPRKQSMYSDMSIEEDDSQEAEPSAQSSQETAAFKKPDAPASKKHKGQLSLLQGLLAKQELQTQFLLQQLKQSQEQMEAQRRQSQEQMEAQRRQSQEQIQMLKQLLDRR